MVEVRNLTKTYGEKTADDDLGFTVRPGAVTAVGFLLRSTAGAVASLFGLLLVVPTLGLLLPSSRQDHLLPHLPSYAGSTVTSVRAQPDLLSPAAGALTLAAWALIPLFAAAVALRHRDA